jgi:hypothetical protein
MVAGAGLNAHFVRVVSRRIRDACVAAARLNLLPTQNQMLTSGKKAGPVGTGSFHFW